MLDLENLTVWWPLSAALVALVIIWLVRRGGRTNGPDWGHPLANLVDRFARWYCRRVHHLETPGIHLPEGPCIVVSNHVSGLDPFLLVTSTDRPLRFIIAKEEYERPGFTWLFKAARCIPVDRSGRVESAFREALRALQRGEVVALFPHGKIHLDEEPERPLKRGVFKLAELAQVPIVAARITGVNAQGTVFKSIVTPSHSKVEPVAVIAAGESQRSDWRERLGHLLLGKLDKESRDVV
jgi:1-acyl-sn-glycerol-3-phosphate acyltransferase